MNKPAQKTASAKPVSRTASAALTKAKAFADSKRGPVVKLRAALARTTALSADDFGRTKLAFTTLIGNAKKHRAELRQELRANLRVVAEGEEVTDDYADTGEILNQIINLAETGLDQVDYDEDVPGDGGDMPPAPAAEMPAPAVAAPTRQPMPAAKAPVAKAAAAKPVAKAAPVAKPVAKAPVAKAPAKPVAKAPAKTGAGSVIVTEDEVRKWDEGREAPKDIGTRSNPTKIIVTEDEVRVSDTRPAVNAKAKPKATVRRKADAEEVLSTFVEGLQNLATEMAESLGDTGPEQDVMVDDNGVAPVDEGGVPPEDDTNQDRMDSVDEPPQAATGFESAEEEVEAAADDEVTAADDDDVTAAADEVEASDGEEVEAAGDEVEAAGDEVEASDDDTTAADDEATASEDAFTAALNDILASDDPYPGNGAPDALKDKRIKASASAKASAPPAKAAAKPAAKAPPARTAAVSRQAAIQAAQRRVAAQDDENLRILAESLIR